MKLTFHFLILIFTFVSTILFAAVDDQVFITGRIMRVIEKNRVRVIDSDGQTYFIPKKYFKPGFKFELEKSFSLEMPVEDFKKLDIKINSTK